MSYLSDRSEALAALPDEDRPKCEGFCKFIRVYNIATGPRWRCTACLHYYTGRIEQQGLFD